MTSIVSTEDISESAFAAALDRYPAVIKAISDAKGAKTGQQTLEELDQFRYATAPARFRPGERREAMSLDDIKTLVAWKLKHGKFRPTLMKLVESNDKTTAETTVKAALDAYEASLKASQASKSGKSGKSKSDKNGLVNAHAHASTVAVGVLSRLRGIGPATASLLAAVHYPQQTIFFSDEAYAWLCGASGSGYQRPSKYNDKEYAALTKAAAELMIRLDKTAQEVEQVAYVLINDSDPLKKEEKEKKEAKKTAPKAKAPKATQLVKLEETEKPAPNSTDRKRKQPPAEAPAARRSSRLRG